jgi:hypothetical protein
MATFVQYAHDMPKPIIGDRMMPEYFLAWLIADYTSACITEARVVGRSTWEQQAMIEEVSRALQGAGQTRRSSKDG